MERNIRKFSTGPNITFCHTCRLVGHEQATLLVCFFGHTCSPEWTPDQNHGTQVDAFAAFGHAFTRLWISGTRVLSVSGWFVFF